jgi:hypothetical protein
MISDEHFYRYFQINYFDYKASYLKYLLNNFESLGLKEKIIGYDSQDFINAIKCDIRQTTFQAIETSFELLFSFRATTSKKINTPLIEIITTSGLPYEEIKKISESLDGLNFLDSKVKLANKKFTTLGHFIFYPGIKQSFLKVEIIESLKTIKQGLHILAKEFSDRREYNSYKHGLRILPTLKELSIFQPGKPDKGVSFDLNGTMTYFSRNKEKEEIQFVTKTFDSERDIRMIEFCSLLLWNMIKLRDFTFNGIGKNESSEAFLFKMESVEDIKRTDVKIQDFVYSIKRMGKS